MNGADVIIKCLEEEGVRMVFGYPGVAIAPFYHSLLASPIREILVRTEQNAAHAASGQARTTGEVGVCAVTSGPGATNVLTGIATAFADSIPMVCITGQVISELIGSDVFQEADITGAAESFVKYSYLIKDVADIPRVFKEAFHIASTGRKGPVLIDVPMDIQNAIVKEFVYPKEVHLRTYKPTVHGHAVQIKRVIGELEKSDRPLICAGGGVLLSDAQEELRNFAKAHHIPVVSTMMGIGAMQTEDDLYLGMVGNNGRPCANRAVSEADLILMVGARVADRAINEPTLIVEDKVLVHIDVDTAEIGKNVGAHIPLVGDAKDIFADFMKQEFHKDYAAWAAVLATYKKEMEPKRTPNPKFVDPAALIALVSKKMKQDGIYVADVGQNQIWSCNYHIVREGKFFTTGGMGTMGYSIPAAMGAKCADPSREVVAVCGDGSFQMSMMEFATMRQHGITSKVIVLSNNCLGMVREFQQFVYDKTYAMIDLAGSPDLQKIAEAYGMSYLRLEQMEEAESMVEAFLAEDTSVLMECVIDPADIVRFV